VGIALEHLLLPLLFVVNEIVNRVDELPEPFEATEASFVQKIDLFLACLLRKHGGICPEEEELPLF